MNRTEILSALDHISTAICKELSLAGDFSLSSACTSAPLRVYIPQTNTTPEIALPFRLSHICLNNQQVCLFLIGPGDLLIVVAFDVITKVLSMFLLDASRLPGYSHAKIQATFPRQYSLLQLYEVFRPALVRGFYLTSGVWTPLTLG